MSSEQSNTPVAAEVDEAITAEVEEKKETKAESMEVESPAVDAPSEEASVESPVTEKPKGKAKAPAKKKAAAVAPKKAAAAPKRAAKKVAAVPAPASPPKPAVPVVAPKVKAPAAAKKPTAKDSASGSHPPYLEMIVSAVEALKERNGSSRQAILKYITSTYDLGVDNKMANVHLKQGLKRGIAVGTLKNTTVSCCL